MITYLSMCVGLASLSSYEVLTMTVSEPCNPVGDAFRNVKSWAKIGSDWSQMGQIRDFLRSVSVPFRANRQSGKFRARPIILLLMMCHISFTERW